jgi:hypothetical protein
MLNLIKKTLILSFLFLISVNISYASFPITDSKTETQTNILLEDDEEEDDGIKWGILIPLVITLGLGSYFLLRSWFRAWKNDVKWVRIFTYVILGVISLILLLSVICSLAGGCIYNMA